MTDTDFRRHAMNGSICDNCSNIMIETLKDINRILAIYGTPIFGIVGFVANLFACISLPLCHRHKKINRHTIYLTVLASVELLFNITWFWLLLIPLFSFQIKHFYHDNNIACKVYNVLLQFILSLALNIILAMTVDRCMAFQLPLRSRNWTGKSALIISGTVATVNLVLSLPYGLVYLVKTDKANETHCVSDYANKISEQVFTWFQILVQPNGMLVIMATFIANIVLINNLVKHHRKHLKLFTESNNNLARNHNQSRKEFRSSLQIILLSTVFLALTTSVNSVYIIWMYMPSIAAYELAQILTTLFLFQQNSIFVGYCISASKKFFVERFCR